MVLVLASLRKTPILHANFRRFYPFCGSPVRCDQYMTCRSPLRVHVGFAVVTDVAVEPLSRRRPWPAIESSSKLGASGGACVAPAGCQSTAIEFGGMRWGCADRY